MSKIIGNTTTTPYPNSDWNQNDSTKADYIRNKPNVSEKYTMPEDGIPKEDLEMDVQNILDSCIVIDDLEELTNLEVEQIIFSIGGL